jgi:hypothetical protein
VPPGRPVQAGGIRRRRKELVRYDVAYHKLPREPHNAALHLFSASPELVDFGRSPEEGLRTMGVSVHYWAIPPQSRLYARLQEDRAFNALMASLFPYGGGIFRFSEIEPEGVEEILDDVVQRQRAALGPGPAARRRIAEFLAELERTRAEFPGIERRTAMLEKCSPEIEERLIRALQHVRTDAAELTRHVLFGDKELAAHLRQPGEDILGLVSLPVVREGAAALERLRPEELFPSGEGREEWYRDNYLRWRQVYREAAEHAEELLVGVS